MPDVDLKKQLGLLTKLQSIDTQIYSLQQEKEATPLKIKEFDEAFAKKKENLAQLEKKALDLQKQRKAKELELASREEEGRKMQNQLYQLKTNKEYDAKLKEIAGVKADVSVFEDEILVLLDGLDKSKGEVDKEKQLLAEEEKKINTQKQELNFRAKEIEEKLHQLEAHRKQLVEEIAPSMLSKYERVLANRNSLAIVKVENNACQGCFMQVSPQVINLIKMYENIIVCEVCQRILYIDE
ncbi:MAG: C4-type zinc ribbon domain-containing protein [Candidatus Omnitrophota bacterium]